MHFVQRVEAGRQAGQALFLLKSESLVLYCHSVPFRSRLNTALMLSCKEQTSIAYLRFVVNTVGMKHDAC